MMPLLKAQGVAIEGRLRATNLEARPGEIIGLIGPNGSGKTSLLRALAGIERTSGTVHIDGNRLESGSPAGRARLVGFLPASRDIAWPIAARDIVALGLPSPDEGRVADLLGLLELEPMADRSADRLSTGERSRVLLARALAARPRLLLLDEPLSNLDPYWVLRVLEIARMETRANGSAALVSVHDLNQVASFDRALLMDQGAVAGDSPPQDMLESTALTSAFRIEREGSGWKIRAAG